MEIEEIRTYLKAEFGDQFEEMEQRAISNMQYWHQHPCIDFLGATMGETAFERDQVMKPHVRCD